jgi:hypothetical protein
VGGSAYPLVDSNERHIELFQTEGACQNNRCLAPVVARARHRGLRIQDQHRDAASGAHGLTPSVLNSARHLSSSLAVDLRSSTILLAGASLPRLFFDYLGQGFELSAKPIKMFFVPFRLSKQLH